MATKWPYDGFELPTYRAEPYGLWFEFLKLALKDPYIRIDKAFYKTWGPYEDSEFVDWWDGHWQELFAVSVGVRKLTSKERKQPTNRELIVSIPLHQDKGRSVSQIKQLLDDHGAGTQLKKRPKGQFFLSVGDGANGRPIHPSTRFLKNLSKVRLYMDLYRCWLKHPGLADDRRLEAMSKDYVAWADPYKHKVRSRYRGEIPTPLADYVRYLEERGDRHRLPLVKYNKSDTPNNRRQVARYLRKARKIAFNVGQGIFPGRY